MHLVDDAEQRRKMVEAMLMWNTTIHFVYIDVAGSGLLVGEAERQGKVVVVDRARRRRPGDAPRRTGSRSSGLANVLRHFGVLRGRGRDARAARAGAGGDRPRDRRRRATSSRRTPATGRRSSTSGTASRGPAVGRIHFIERPDREPRRCTAARRRRLLVRAIATTEQGDKCGRSAARSTSAELA